MKIIHALRNSDGASPAGGGVKLTDRNVRNVQTSGTCHSGIRLGADGVLYLIQGNGGVSAQVGQWLLGGSAASFYVQRTIVSGTLQTDAGTGWLQLNASRDYDNQKSTSGVKTTEVMFEISSDVSGTPVVASANHTYVSEQGLQ